MALNEIVRSTLRKVAEGASKRPIMHRAKIAFGVLQHHHPKAIKGVTFEQFYSGICTHRHLKGLGPKRMRRSPPVETTVTPVNELNQLEDVITFLTTNGETLASYERLKANMPTGLKIVFTPDNRPVLALDN